MDTVVHASPIGKSNPPQSATFAGYVTLQVHLH